MTRIRLAWAAFKNMMRAAAQDPIWAFLALLAMPFRIWKPLAGFLFILIIVTFVIGMGGRHFLDQMGFGHGSPVYIIPGVLTWWRSPPSPFGSSPLH